MTDSYTSFLLIPRRGGGRPRPSECDLYPAVLERTRVPNATNILPIASGSRICCRGSHLVQGLHRLGKRMKSPNKVQVCTGESRPHRRGAFSRPTCKQPRQCRAEGLGGADRVAAKPPAEWCVRRVRLQGLSRRGWTLVRPEVKTPQTSPYHAPLLRPDPRRTHAWQLNLERSHIQETTP